jgi:hypothetical protein
MQSNAIQSDPILVKVECGFDLNADSNRFPIPRRWLKTPILDRTHCLGRKPRIIALNKCCRAYSALLVDQGVKLNRPLVASSSRFIFPGQLNFMRQSIGKCSILIHTALCFDQASMTREQNL